MDRDHQSRDDHRNGSPDARMAHERPDRQHASSDRGRRPTSRGGKGWFFLIALGLLIFLAILAAFGIWSAVANHQKRDQTSRAVQAGAQTVRVTHPTRSPAVFDFTLPGSSEPLTTATLYARVNGYLKSRLVDIGDHIQAGQLLAEIEAPDLDAQLNQSRAQLEQNRAALGIARVTYEREQRLLAQKVVAQQEYDQSEATYNQAVANVKAAEANVQNLSVQQGFEKIIAPFTGVVTVRALDTGALIASGSTAQTPAIYTLAQTDVLRVYIYVPQAYAPNVKVGQEVEVTAPELPKKAFKGRVTRTADSLDPTARTERVEIQLPSEDGQLLPGMYLDIRFKVEQSEPALVVPAETLDIRRDGPRVALVDDDQKIHYQDVKLGRAFGKTIEIIGGLKGNETVVVNPTTDLLEGEKVDIAKDTRDAPK